MGWKTDWLYRLVFQEFSCAWDRAQGEGGDTSGRPPVALHVTEHDDVCPEGPAFCCGEPIRSWDFAGEGWEEVPLRERTPDDRAVHGMFVRVAVGSFHISEDRKTMAVEYVFGPRYGHGSIFAVRGQGKRAKLVPKPGSEV